MSRLLQPSDKLLDALYPRVILEDKASAELTSEIVPISHSELVSFWLNGKVKLGGRERPYEKEPFQITIDSSSRTQA